MSKELAIISIIGGRYAEAEKMYGEELKISLTPDTYFGLALCKMNLLFENLRNVDEIIYCFEKSINLVNAEQKSELEDKIIELCNNTLSQLNALYHQLESQKSKEANKALLSGALAIGATLIGTSKGSGALTAVASGVAAGAGVGVSMESLSKLGEIPEIQSFIKNTSIELVTKLRSVLGTRYDNFERGLIETGIVNLNENKVIEAKETVEPKKRRLF